MKQAIGSVVSEATNPDALGALLTPGGQPGFGRDFVEVVVVGGILVEANSRRVERGLLEEYGL